jgi:hypothetical protein
MQRQDPGQGPLAHPAERIVGKNMAFSALVVQDRPRVPYNDIFPLVSDRASTHTTCAPKR